VTELPAAGLAQAQQQDSSSLEKGLKGLGGLSALSLVVLMVLTCADVIGRYFFNAPITGALEASEILMGVLIFAALPLASRHEGHITIDILDQVTPRKVLRIQTALMSLVASAFMGFLGYRMWVYASKLVEYGDRTMMLKIPLAPINFFLSVMLFVTALVLLVNALKGIRR